jgi:hypothetical protein
MKKYFISCVSLTKQLGAIQLETETLEEAQTKSEELCPEPANFKLYEVEEFDSEMPIGEFVSAERMKELGY